jgi:hypothetical protein
MNQLADKPGFMKTVLPSDSGSLRVTEAKRSSNPRERIPMVVVYIFLIFLIGSLSLFYLIYGGILAAYRIGDVFQMSWLGFPVIFIAYALMGMVIWRTRKHLLRIPFLSTLILNFTKE